MKSTRALCIILVSIIADGVMANKYVDPINGHDTNYDGSQMIIDGKAGPYRTIARAIATVNDGHDVILAGGTYDTASQGSNWSISVSSAKSITFRPEDPNNMVVLRPADGAGYKSGVFVPFNDITRTIVFRSLVIQPTAEVGYLVNCYSGSAAKVVFEDCVLDAGNGILAFAGDDTTGPRRQITFRNCTMTSGHNTPFYIKSAALFKIEGGSFDSGLSTDGVVFYMFSGGAAVVERLEIDNCRFTCRKNCLRPDNADEIGYFRVKGNTFWIAPVANGVHAISINDRVKIGQILIQNNTILYDGNTIPTAIHLGAVKQSYTDFIRAPVIINNSIHNRKAGYYGSGIRLGTNVRGAYVAGNRITGFEHSIYNNSRYSVIANNSVVGSNGMLVWGGGDHVISGNLFVSVDGHAHGRCIVFGRSVFAESTSVTAFTATTVTDNGTNPWNGNQTNVLDGLLALVGQSLNPTHWGVVQSINGNEVTVNSWTTASLTPITEIPPGGVRVQIVEFGEHNTVLHNIFDGSRAQYTMTQDYNPRDGGDLIDYNCYRSGLYCFGIMGEANQYSLAEFVTKWSTWSTLHPYNDAHSIEVDPRFVNVDTTYPASSDLTPQNWQILEVSRPYFGAPVCDKPIPGDINSDCIVNFVDLAIIGLRWLERSP